MQVPGFLADRPEDALIARPQLTVLAFEPARLMNMIAWPGAGNTEDAAAFFNKYRACAGLPPIDPDEELPTHHGVVPPQRTAV